MPHITLIDNNFANLVSLTTLLKDDVDSQIHAYEDLQLVANKNLKELCKNQSLLVFPQCLGEHDDGIEEQFIVQFEGSAKINDEDKIVSCDDVKIKTGNLMGFIGFSGKGCHGTKLEIRSRFAENNKTENNNQDFFLHYMLEKVFKINLFNLNYSYSNSSGFDFIYLIFPYFLKRALNQGLFKTYKTFERNDSAVKGAINVSRHIRQNVPFGGRIVYRSREYTFDNHIMQLIRHTIEFVKTKPVGKSILAQDEEIRKAVSQIVEVTNETYSLQKRSKVIFENLKPLNHPYYLDYNYLQKICLMILNNVNSQYSTSSSPIYGILFDGAWLWEEYLWTILKDAELGGKNFEHPTNKDRKGGIRLFDNSLDPEDSSFKKCYRRIYPDFYRENTKPENEDFLKNDGVILDAKYKQLDKGLVRDDLYQIISYMHTMKIPTGGFVYPVASTTLRNRESAGNVVLDTYCLANNTGFIKSFGFVIPECETDYAAFQQEMRKTEDKLVQEILS